MAVVTLETFESGADGGDLRELIRSDEPVAGGGTYSLNVIHVSVVGSSSSANFRHLGTGGEPPVPGGVVGEWAGQSSSGWNLAGEHSPSDGLGFYFRLAVGFLGDGDAQGSTATITWSSQGGGSGGQFRVEHMPDDTLEVSSLWYSGEESASEGPWSLVRTEAEWYQIEFTRPGGWFIKRAETGETLLSSDYPFSMPSSGLTWNHSILLGGIPTPDDTEIDEAWVDQIYGYTGRNDRPAVRLYPRDDGRGMSSAPRIWPMPKSNRIIGGYQ